MKFIILLLIAFYACLFLSKTNYVKAWKDYKKKFKKSYGPKEDAERKQIYMENVKMITKHNKEADAGKHLYYMGVNEFTDMSDEELESEPPCVLPATKSSSGGKKDFPHMCDSNKVPRSIDWKKRGRVTPVQYQTDEELESSPPCVLATKSSSGRKKDFPQMCDDSKVPDSIDWNKRGRVTPVQDQEPCGACYAFAAVGALEGQVAAKTGKLIQLSEQMIVDCSTENGNNGCQYGCIAHSFDFVKKKGGLPTEKEYPYTGKEGSCKKLKPSVPINMKRYYYTSNGTEEELKRAVGTVGPVAVGIASQDSFHRYGHGIYMDPKCASKDFKHATLVIGYNTDGKGTDYWIIKNSNGTGWGMKGFMHLKRNSGTCRIGELFSYPILV